MAPGTTLLAAVRRAGLPLASACDGAALCGRCAVRILDGAGALSEEDPLERRAKRANRVESGLRLACCARVRGDLELTAACW